MSDAFLKLLQFLSLDASSHWIRLIACHCVVLFRHVIHMIQLTAYHTDPLERMESVVRRLPCVEIRRRTTTVTATALCRPSTRRQPLVVRQLQRLAVRWCHGPDLNTPLPATTQLMRLHRPPKNSAVYNSTSATTSRSVANQSYCSPLGEREREREERCNTCKTFRAIYEDVREFGPPYSGQANWVGIVQRWTITITMSLSRNTEA